MNLCCFQTIAATAVVFLAALYLADKGGNDSKDQMKAMEKAIEKAIEKSIKALTEETKALRDELVMEKEMRVKEKAKMEAIIMETENEAKVAMEKMTANTGSNSNYPYDYFKDIDIVRWIPLLQDMFEKFDYTDRECHKKLICEVYTEATDNSQASKWSTFAFMVAAQKVKLNLSEDMRTLLDEYLTPISQGLSQGDCGEPFKCSYSIKDYVNRQ